MNDDASVSSNTLKSKNYITISDAANLAKSPFSYIESLCKDNQIEHAYDKDGNFLVESASFLKVLNLEDSILSEISLVDNSKIADNLNGLPEHWLLKTNKEALSHHEDLPLFPQLKPKILIEEKGNTLMSDNNKELIESKVISNQIDSPVLDNLIGNNTDKDYISSPTYVKLESPIRENIIDSGKVDNNHLLNKGDISNKVEDINENRAYENKFSAEPKIVDDFIDDNYPLVEDIENNNYPKVENVLNTKSNSNPAKVLSVPHPKVNETISSFHPLANPPVVFPISTNTPSLKTKIAAIYTQPDAMASKWLPWMRTSMWPRKMVKRTVSNVEIKIEDSDKNTKLMEVSPLRAATSRNNLVENKIFIPKNQTEVLSIATKNTIDSPATNIHMEDTVKKETVVEPKIAVTTIEDNKQIRNSAIKIDDALDSALFSEFAINLNNKTDIPVNSSSSSASNIPTQKKQSFQKPIINDSWDSKIFG